MYFFVSFPKQGYRKLPSFSKITLKTSVRINTGHQYKIQSTRQTFFPTVRSNFASRHLRRLSTIHKVAKVAQSAPRRQSYPPIVVFDLATALHLTSYVLHTQSDNHKHTTPYHICTYITNLP